MPENAWREAEVALAGPVLGSSRPPPSGRSAPDEHSKFLIALAFVGFFINLFNLIPIVPLDGGRAVAALHPAIWLLGLGGLVALEIVQAEPDPAADHLGGRLELWRRWRRGKQPGRPATTR